MTPILHLALVLRALTISPAFWAGSALLTGLWLTHFAFSPFGITLSSTPQHTATKEIAFLATLGCVTLSMVGTRSFQAQLKRAAWSVRFSNRLLVPAMSATFSAWIVSLLPLIAGEAPSTELLLGIPICAVHLAAIGTVLGFLPSTRTVQSVSLPLTAWLFPALLGDTSLGRFASGLLDASRHLDLGSRDYSVLAGGVAPILGMVCLAIALDPPLRALHEVRHPR